MTDLLLGDPDPLDAIVAELRKFDEWESDDRKDRALAQQLVEAYPRLDIIAEIRSWRMWMLDHDDGKKVRPRARIANWCRNAVRFGRDSGTSPAVRTRPSRSSTRARTAEEFGATSERSSRW